VQRARLSRFESIAAGGWPLKRIRWLAIDLTPALRRFVNQYRGQAVLRQRFGSANAGGARADDCDYWISHL
jgi:hypothetical protein